MERFCNAETPPAKKARIDMETAEKLPRQEAAEAKKGNEPKEAVKVDEEVDEEAPVQRRKASLMAMQESEEDDEEESEDDEQEAEEDEH